MSKKNSIIKNYIYNSLYAMMNIILPIITIPYVSRVLLAEGVGKVSYAQNIVSYFTLFASLGIPNYGVREIAKTGNDKCIRTKVFSELFQINAISSLIASVVYYVAVFRLKPLNSTLYYVVGLSIIFNSFNIDWFYKGIEEFKYITIRSYIVKLISLLLIFLLIRDSRDVVLYAIILTLANNVNYIFNVIHIRKFILFDEVKGRTDIKRHFISIVTLFAASLAVELYTQLDTTMVGSMCGATNVGYYSNSMKIVKVVAVAVTALGTVLLPRLSLYYQEGNINQIKQIVKKSIEILLLISLPCSVGIFLLREEIVFVFFGNSFKPAIYTLAILSLLIPILAIGNIFGTQLMIVFNDEKKLTFTVIIGALINLPLNLLLIPSFQQDGAALASVIAELSVMLLQICIMNKKLKIRINATIILKLIIQLFFMIISISFVRMNVDEKWLSMLFSILLGSFVYFMVGLLIRNPVICECINVVKNRVKTMRRGNLDGNRN